MQITTLHELGTAVLEGRRIVIPSHWTYCHSRPARFFDRMNQKRLLSLMEKGMFIYEPKNKRP